MLPSFLPNRNNYDSYHNYIRKLRALRSRSSVLHSVGRTYFKAHVSKYLHQVLVCILCQFLDSACDKGSCAMVRAQDMYAVGESRYILHTHAQEVLSQIRCVIHKSEVSFYSPKKRNSLNMACLPVDTAISSTPK